MTKYFEDMPTETGKTMANKLMTRDAIREINADLIALGAKLGYKFNIQGGKFDSTSYRPKLSIEIIDTSGASVDAEKKFRAYAPLFGIPVDAYGKTFQHGTGTWKIVSIMPRRRKYPIEAENTCTGKRMLFTTSTAGRCR